MSTLEQAPLAVPAGSGKGSLYIAEQLTFQNAFWEGGAVDSHKWHVPPAAGPMNSLSKHFLAYTRLPLDEHSLVHLGVAQGQPERLRHAGAVPQNVVKGIDSLIFLGGERTADTDLGAHDRIYVLKDDRHTLQRAVPLPQDGLRMVEKDSVFQLGDLIKIGTASRDDVSDAAELGTDVIHRKGDCIELVQLQIFAGQPIHHQDLTQAVHRNGGIDGGLHHGGPGLGFILPLFQIGLGQRDGLSDLGIPGLDEYSRDPVLLGDPGLIVAPHQYIDVLDLLQLMGDLFRGHSRKPYQINGEQVPDIKHILQNSAEAKDSDALSQLRCLQQSVHNVLRLQIHHNYGDIHALAHDFCKHAEGDQNFGALGYLAAGYLLKILGIGEDHLAVGRGFPQNILDLFGGQQVRGNERNV